MKLSVRVFKKYMTLGWTDPLKRHINTKPAFKTLYKLAESDIQIYIKADIPTHRLNQPIDRLTDNPANPGGTILSANKQTNLCYPWMYYYIIILDVLLYQGLSK